MRRLLPAVCALCLVAAAPQRLDPARYVDLTRALLESALEGGRRMVDTLRLKPADAEQQVARAKAWMVEDEKRILRQFGITPEQLKTWAEAHRGEVDAYLAREPDKQRTLVNLGLELRSVWTEIAALSALAPGKPHKGGSR